CLCDVPPRFWRDARSMSQYSRSMARGSSPSTTSSKSRTHPTTPYGFRLSLHSPQPTSPSSVSTFTNTQGRHPASHRNACTRLMRMSPILPGCATSPEGTHRRELAPRPPLGRRACRLFGSPLAFRPQPHVPFGSPLVFRPQPRECRHFGSPLAFRARPHVPFGSPLALHPRPASRRFGRPLALRPRPRECRSSGGVADAV